ncbi:MAG: hypothetical protein ACLFR0_01125 [Alphaproteobacteria bacterium]
MIFNLVQYTLWGAMRDRMVFSMLGIMVLGACLSLFLGSAAVMEQDQFVLVYAGGGLRLAVILGLVLFVVSFIRKSFETKDVEFLLSRPVSRVQLVLAYSFAFSLIAILSALALGLVIYAIAPHLFSEGHILWIASIGIENIIMVNTALFFAMIITSAAGAAIATLGFYLLCRMMGQILGIAASGSIVQSGKMDEIMRIVVETISMFLPRLDLLGQTSWLVYGEAGVISYGFIIMQGLVFTGLIVTACLFDLVRRQF